MSSINVVDLCFVELRECSGEIEVIRVEGEFPGRVVKWVMCEVDWISGSRLIVSDGVRFYRTFRSVRLFLGGEVEGVVIPGVVVSFIRGIIG